MKEINYKELYILILKIVSSEDYDKFRKSKYARVAYGEQNRPLALSCMGLLLDYLNIKAETEREEKVH